MTQVGQQIPAGWKVSTLGEIADVKNGKTNSQDAQEYGEYPLFDRSSAIKRSDKYLFDSTAIIIPGEGTEFIPKFFSGKFDLHQRAYAAYSFREGVSPMFVYYNIDYFKKYFEKVAVGSTVKSLRLPHLVEYPILLPPPIEQTRIAAILSKVDEEIEKVDQIIEQTEKLKKGLMQKLLTKGIGHTKFKQSELGEIPEEWEVKEFIDFATLQRGFDLPKQSRTEGMHPLVSSNGVTDEISEYKVKAPGVVTGRSGTIGKVFYIENDFWPLNTTLYIKDFHGNEEKFVYYAILYFDLSAYHTGTGVPTLNRNVVHSKKIAVPQVDEQKKIAAILEAIDTKLTAFETNKSKLLKLKKGLMSDLLSGKVRVTNM